MIYMIYVKTFVELLRLLRLVRRRPVDDEFVQVVAADNNNANAAVRCFVFGQRPYRSFSNSPLPHHGCRRKPRHLLGVTTVSRKLSSCHR